MRNISIAKAMNDTVVYGPGQYTAHIVGHNAHIACIVALIVAFYLLLLLEYQNNKCGIPNST